MNWFLLWISTVSTGTLRRSETSMNPKQLAFLASCFVLRPPTKDRKCNNEIFHVFTLKK